MGFPVKRHKGFFGGGMEMFSNGIVVMVVQLCKLTKNHYNCEFKTGISIIPQYNSYFKMLGSFSTPKEWPNYSTSLQMAFS